MAKKTSIKKFFQRSVTLLLFLQSDKRNKKVRGIKLL